MGFAHREEQHAPPSTLTWLHRDMGCRTAFAPHANLLTGITARVNLILPVRQQPAAFRHWPKRGPHLHSASGRHQRQYLTLGAILGDCQRAIGSIVASM